MVRKKNNKFKRKIRGIYFRIYYTLFLKHKINKTVKEKIGNFTFTVFPSVFNPRIYLSSEIFGNFLTSLDLNGKYVLDLGCGSGVQGIFAASRGAQCLCVDKNPYSVKCTIVNAEQNKLNHRIKVLQSDLFSNIDNGEKFNIILFNPPYYKGIPNNDFEMSFKGGDNFEVLESFLGEAKRFISDNAEIYMILSSDVDSEVINNLIQNAGYISEQAFTKKKYFETFYILKLNVKNFT